MQLNLDVGNSRVHWLLLPAGLEINSPEALVVWEEAPRGVCVDLAELRKQLGAIQPKPKVTELSLASVRQDEETKASLLKALRAEYGLEPRLVKVASGKHDLTFAYKNPTKLGVDRYLAMVGALEVMSRRLKASAAGAWLVIDSGTALTLDLVYCRQHFGGLILPNAGLMREAFYAKTGLSGKANSADALASYAAAGEASARPASQAGDFRTALGKDTESCLALGTSQAIVALLQERLRHFFADYPTGQVVITGGGGKELCVALSKALPAQALPAQAASTFPAIAQSALHYESHLVCLGLSCC